MKVSAKLQTARQMQQDIVLNRTLQEIEKASNILFLKLNNTSYTETAKLLNYLKFFCYDTWFDERRHWRLYKRELFVKPCLLESIA